MDTELQELRCAYCGKNMTKETNNGADMATIEHIIAKANGGTNNGYNKIAVCRTCNQEKNNMTLEEYRLLWLKRVNGFLTRMGRRPATIEEIRFYCEGGQGQKAADMCNFSRMPKPVEEYTEEEQKGLSVSELVARKMDEELAQRVTEIEQKIAKIDNKINSHFQQLSAEIKKKQAETIPTCGSKQPDLEKSFVKFTNKVTQQLNEFTAQSIQGVAPGLVQINKDVDTCKKKIVKLEQLTNTLKQKIEK